jgi:hypothetical protein
MCDALVCELDLTIGDLELKLGPCQIILHTSARRSDSQSTIDHNLTALTTRLTAACIW